MKCTRYGALLGLLLVTLGFSVAHAQPVFTQVVKVPYGTPTLFSLATGAIAGYTFVIIELPANGTLIGTPPDLTYIPREGFSGADWIAFTVTSPAGVLDLVTVRIVVLPPGEEMTMPALLAEGELVFSGPTYAVDSYRFVFSLTQKYRYFEQSLRATWTHAGFTSFVGTTRIALEGALPIAWRLPITSTLAFDPTIPALSSWTVDARTTLLDATWIWTFFYSGTAPQTGSYARFQVQGQIGDFAFDTLIEYITLTPTFGRARLILKGPWICADCPTLWEFEFLHTKAGFEHLSFLVKDVEIPCPACAWFGLLFDAKVTFTVDEKTIEPALRIESAVVACVRPLVALPTPTSWFGFEGIEVYGVEIRCDAAGGYTLRLATSFNPARNSAVTGDLRFFELWQLEGPVVPCCGNPGRFQISGYFKHGTGNLFGLAMGNIVVYFPLSRELLVNLGLRFGEVDALDPTKTWILTFGWQGLW